MPLRSQITLRLALGYMVAAATLGAWMLVGKTIPHTIAWTKWLPLHIAWMVGGGFLQFIMGTAFWILPKFANQPSFYGRVYWFDLAVISLNGGLFLFTVAQFLPPGSFWQALSRWGFGIAVFAFIAHIFPRIKPFRSEEPEENRQGGQ